MKSVRELDFAASATLDDIVESLHRLDDEMSENEYVNISRRTGPFSMSSEVFFRVLSFWTAPNFICLSVKRDCYRQVIQLKRRTSRSAKSLGSSQRYFTMTIIGPRKANYVNTDSNFIAKIKYIYADDFYLDGSSIIDVQRLLLAINGDYLIVTCFDLNKKIFNSICNFIESPKSRYHLFHVKTCSYMGSDTIAICVSKSLLQFIKFNQCRWQTLDGLCRYLFTLSRLYSVIIDSIEYDIVPRIINPSYEVSLIDNDISEQVSGAFCQEIQHFWSFNELNSYCSLAAKSGAEFIEIAVNSRSVDYILILIKRLSWYCPRSSIVLIAENNCLLRDIENKVSSCCDIYVIKYARRFGEVVLLLIPDKRDVYASISQWSFGVITDGKAPQNVEAHVRSIEALRISEYEIIICGPYTGYTTNNCRIIDVTESDQNGDIRGWITKKKNVIVDLANYENCMISHDRITFSPKWFENLNRHPHNFDVLVFPVRGVDRAEYRVNDWERYDGTYLEFNSFKLFPMSYDFWNPSAMIYGGAFAIKKNVYKRIPLDERLFWSEAEDVLQSELFSLNGIVVDMAPDSILYSLRGRLRGYKDAFFNRMLVAVLRFLVYGRFKAFLLYFLYLAKCARRN